MSKALLTSTRVILFTIGIVIIVDCVALMAIGKINFGSVVPLLLGIIFVAHGLFWHAIRRFFGRNHWLNRLWYGLWAVFTIWLISFGLFIWSLQQQITLSMQPAPTVTAIIILGSGTVAGKPTPTLAKRLDTAVPLIKSQPSALVITSGGVGFQRTRSEADIMATYLHDSHDIAFERILQEGKSTSTEENLANSRDILEEKGLSITDPIAIVTSDFHTVRAASIAKHQGYQQPITVASSTPLSIRYNAWFREYFAFVSGWLLGEY
ncbi:MULTISPECIES: ElyC/SanA/YdcF family protein [unclassified Psychrobacter]|uniref:YdcF family protein n=1 Tax=unclassified Psychrobacter TaxID=196806 RepID=UPI0025B40734|nr:MULTISPECIES: ElyC/SanA/YdcF family protein [unclassified Psychrobacter]MDN3453361.1 ElyC/SanA/YdcF family protein [Psychrobacter sp. APC 3350]MDN3501829.1 ElyC/SanA/YdcF family protein [Psychrobacter sp. 5A.1]